METNQLLSDFELFDDLFFDTISSSSSSSPESLKNSPLGLDFNPIAWENFSKDELWGSIIDDLPDELSDSGTDCSRSPDNELAASAQMYGISGDVQNDYLSSIDMLGMSKFGTPAQSQVNEHAAPIKVDSTENNCDESASTYDSNVRMDNSNIVPSTPVSIPSAAPVQPVSAGTEQKFQIKIGDKVFTIIQKSGTNVNTSNNAKDAEMEVAESVDAFSDHDYLTTAATVKKKKDIDLGPPLVKLTDEERRLLLMEKMEIPEDMPLTRDEENCLKKVRRKIKNKHSAMESRQRRKDYVDNLERRVKLCTAQNTSLQKKVTNLSADNNQLMTQLKQLQMVVARQQSHSKGHTGTCLGMLVLAFALFILPFNPMHVYKEQHQGVSSTAAPHANSFRSRTLLAVKDSCYHDNMCHHDDNMTTSYIEDVGSEIDLFASMKALNQSLVVPMGSGGDKILNHSYPEDIRVQLELLLLKDDVEDNARLKLDEYMFKTE